MPPRSLQARLLSLVIGLVLAVWLSTAVLTWIDAQHELDELLDAHLAQAAALLVARQASDIDDVHDLDTPPLHRYAPRVAFQVFHHGRLALRSANAPLEPMAAEGRSGFQTIAIAGTRWRVFTTVGARGDEQVHVGEQHASRTSILMALLRSVLWPTLLALPVLALAAWWAVHVSMAPLRRLSHRLARRRPAELQPLQIARAPTELAPLLDALNGLFARIGTLLDSERRFTADAAHELRTPIAAIRAQAQVALAASDEASRRHALTATVEGCDRASRLVDQLLTLSRADAEMPRAGDVDLGELTRSVAAEIAPRAIAKQQSLTLQIEPGCTVRGDGTLLGVLVRNLLDNAVRYSPAGASVAASVRRQPDGVRLAVEDSGPGMDEAQRQRLGERFFRVAGTDESGSGLGWSIVRRIAALHDAQLQAGPSTRLGGLAVEVVLSAAPGQPAGAEPPAIGSRARGRPTAAPSARRAC